MRLLIVGLVSVQLIVQLSSCLSFPGGDTAQDVEMEAFMMIEQELASVSQEQGGHYQKYTEQSAMLMQTLLESRQSELVRGEPEDSWTGELYGLSSSLMRELIEMYSESQLGNTELVSNQSTLMGLRLATLRDNLGVDLPNVSRYLAALIHSTTSLEEQHLGVSPHYDAELQQPEEKKESWWGTVVNWFG